MNPIQPVLKSVLLRLEYTAIEQVQLPQEEVSVWRGLIGRYVRRISPQLNAFFFETPTKILRPLDQLSTAMRGSLGLQGSHVPHPFVLRSPSQSVGHRQHRLNPGDSYKLELVLIEGAAQYLPLLYAMFEDLGLSGVGQRVRQRNGRLARGRMVLDYAFLEIDGNAYQVYDGGAWIIREVDDFDPAIHLVNQVRKHDTVPFRSDTLDLTVKTPLRLFHRGKPIDAKRLSARSLVEAMFRRYYGLACCYAETPPLESEIKEAKTCWVERAEQTTLICEDAGWSERRRYSGRQHNTVSTSGIVGTIQLQAEPDVLAHWRAFFNRMEPLHIGKGTSLGQGWIKVLPSVVAIDLTEFEGVYAN